MSDSAHKHPYHLVDPSPWPLVGAIAAGLLTGGLVLFMHEMNSWIWIVGAIRVTRFRSR